MSYSDLAENESVLPSFESLLRIARPPPMSAFLRVHRLEQTTDKHLFILGKITKLFKPFKFGIYLPILLITLQISDSSYLTESLIYGHRTLLFTIEKVCTSKSNPRLSRSSQRTLLLLDNNTPPLTHPSNKSRSNIRGTLSSLRGGTSSRPAHSTRSPLGCNHGNGRIDEPRACSVLPSRIRTCGRIRHSDVSRCRSSRSHMACPEKRHRHLH